MTIEATPIIISEETRAFIKSLGTCFSTENEFDDSLAVKLIAALGGEESFLNQFADIMVLGPDSAFHELAIHYEVATFYGLNKDILLAYADHLCWDQGWETGAELILSHVEKDGLYEDDVNAFLQEDAASASSKDRCFPVAAWLTWSSLEMLCTDYAKYKQNQRRSEESVLSMNDKT